MLGQRFGPVGPRDDGPDDAQASDSGDVRDDVVQLGVHLHERLLHELTLIGKYGGAVKAIKASPALPPLPQAEHASRYFGSGLNVGGGVVHHLWPASECGRIRRGDGDQGRGDRLRMPFSLPILLRKGN